MTTDEIEASLIKAFNDGVKVATKAAAKEAEFWPEPGPSIATVIRDKAIHHLKQRKR